MYVCCTLRTYLFYTLCNEHLEVVFLNTCNTINYEDTVSNDKMAREHKTSIKRMLSLLCYTLV